MQRSYARALAATGRDFAYGTLPGHPERGEESFVLHRSGADTLLQIRAFSRPNTWYARIGAPVARLVQRRVTAAYLRGIPLNS